MVADLTALATSGAVALVTAAATDAWQVVRAGFARLFARGCQRSGLVESRLDATATALTGAGPGERDRVHQDAVAAWRTRLVDLLEEDPAAVDELRSLIQQASAERPAPGLQVHVSKTGDVIATGGAVANSGYIGDLHVGDR